MFCKEWSYVKLTWCPGCGHRLRAQAGADCDKALLQGRNRTRAITKFPAQWRASKGIPWTHQLRAKAQPPTARYVRDATPIADGERYELTLTVGYDAY